MSTLGTVLEIIGELLVWAFVLAIVGLILLAAWFRVHPALAILLVMGLAGLALKAIGKDLSAP